MSRCASRPCTFVAADWWPGRSRVARPQGSCHPGGSAVGRACNPMVGMVWRYHPEPDRLRPARDIKEEPLDQPAKVPAGRPDRPRAGCGRRLHAHDRRVAVGDGTGRGAHGDAQRVGAAVRGSLTLRSPSSDELEADARPATGGPRPVSLAREAEPAGVRRPRRGWCQHPAMNARLPERSVCSRCGEAQRLIRDDGPPVCRTCILAWGHLGRRRLHREGTPRTEPA